jgi:hypothetical protein
MIASDRPTPRRLFWGTLLLPLVVVGSFISSRSDPLVGSPMNPDSADALFKAGRFSEAEKLYAAAASRDPANHRAVLQMGRLALLSNRFGDAERRLGRAIGLAPADAVTKQLLAETLYRQDRFEEVAALLRGGTDDLKARLLASFRGLTPYQVDGAANEARLAFLQTDPIPVVKVRVNGHDANFIIDTGGSEVYLEPHFAKRIGAVIMSGAEAGGFAGGRTRPVEKGRIDSLGLDRLTVRNLPVNIVDTKFIGRDEVAKGLEISGFLGTILLYHFIPTLDYPKGELILRRKTASNLKRFEAQARRELHTVLPFWMAGDHLMVTWGSARRSQPRLYLIDTGGAGIGFVPGPSVVKDAGIELPRDSVKTDNPLGVTFFKVDEIALGPLVARDVPSVFGPFPASMEDGLGFRMAGIVSHEFFRRYAFTIDFAEMRFFLAAAP